MPDPGAASDPAIDELIDDLRTRPKWRHTLTTWAGSSTQLVAIGFVVSGVIGDHALIGIGLALYGVGAAVGVFGRERFRLGPAVRGFPGALLTGVVWVFLSFPPLAVAVLFVGVGASIVIDRLLGRHPEPAPPPEVDPKSPSEKRRRSLACRLLDPAFAQEILGEPVTSPVAGADGLIRTLSTAQVSAVQGRGRVALYIRALTPRLRERLRKHERETGEPVFGRIRSARGHRALYGEDWTVSLVVTPPDGLESHADRADDFLRATLARLRAA